ncbi:MAG: ABC transporter permease subunit, partial [Ignavibacteria bacterium]|nr:ABC transporter permease subunit [Ignavibacteria bacterium]
IALSTLIGFSVAGAMIFVSNGVEGFASYALFVILSLALALAFLSMALLVSTACRRKVKAFGIAFFLWFFFVLFYDLLALGGTLLLRGQSANMFLFISIFGNPVDMVRVATLMILDNATIFGAAGAVLVRFLGGGTSGTLVLTAALSAWVVVPLIISRSLIRGQDI